MKHRNFKSVRRSVESEFDETQFSRKRLFSSANPLSLNNSVQLTPPIKRANFPKFWGVPKHVR